MHEIELFFKTWMYTAGAFFSTFSFIWVSIKIGQSVYKAIGDRAKIGMRQEWQAEYFDVGEARYDLLLDRLNKLKDDFCEFEKKALQSEIARLKQKD